MADKIEKPNLQDLFLNRLRREKVPVTIHVINGYQLNRLVITGYDNFVVVARNDAGREIMLYKHAISTITPEVARETVELKKEDDKQNG